jgi:hypothetical protein
MTLRSSSLFLVLLLSGCSASQGDRIALLDVPWAVHGVLRSETGAPAADHVVEFVRMQPGEDGSPEARTFSTVRTDAQGNFYLESNVEGRYFLLAKFDFPCMVHVDLGSLGRGTQKDLRLAFNKKRDCKLVI